jgi:hypothetical protein
VKKGMTAIEKVAEKIEWAKIEGLWTRKRPLCGLSLADFRALQSVAEKLAKGETPEFIQADVALWLAKNGVSVQPKDIGFIASA